MGLNQIQKDYIKNVISQNRGSQTSIIKDAILKFATDLGLQLPKSTTKEM